MISVVIDKVKLAAKKAKSETNNPGSVSNDDRSF